MNRSTAYSSLFGQSWLVGSLLLVASCGTEAADGSREAALAPPTPDAQEVPIVQDTLPLDDVISPDEGIDAFTDIGLLPPAMYTTEHCSYRSTVFGPGEHPAASFSEKPLFPTVESMLGRVSAVVIATVEEVHEPKRVIPSGLPDSWYAETNVQSAKDAAWGYTPISLRVDEWLFGLTSQVITVVEAGCLAGQETAVSSVGATVMLMLDFQDLTKGPLVLLDAQYRMIDWFAVNDGVLAARRSVTGAPTSAPFLDQADLTSARDLFGAL